MAIDFKKISITILLDFSFLEKEEKKKKSKKKKNDKMISLVPALDYFYVSFFIDLSYLNNALLSSLFSFLSLFFFLSLSLPVLSLLRRNMVIITV